MSDDLNYDVFRIQMLLIW